MSDELISVLQIILFFIFLITIAINHKSKKRLFDEIKKNDPNYISLFLKTYFFSKITEKLFKNSTYRPVMNASSVLIIKNKKLFDKYENHIIKDELRLISVIFITQTILVALFVFYTILLNFQ
jgi:hypothetical protein